MATTQKISAPAEAGSLWTGRRFWIAAFIFSNMFINYMDRINLSVAAPIIARQFKWDPGLMDGFFPAISGPTWYA